MKTLSVLGILVAAASATNLLLPLYAWPASGAWDNVYKAIEANSRLAFQIIVNPDSGPGSSTAGDSGEYTAGVTKLNSYSNVQLFGYVHCNYDTGSGDEINRNVTQWNAWNADPKTSIDGIFYDEIPNEQGDSVGVTFLASLVKSAKNIFGDHPFKSIFNPGATPEDIKLYDLADHIVVFESEASSYNDAVLSNQIPAGKASQSSILIYDFASQGDDAQLGTWLQDMISAGVGSADILNTGYSEANNDAKPVNGTYFATSRKVPGGKPSIPQSVGNTAFISAPATIRSSEPSYKPHDCSREESQDNEDNENQKYGNIKEDDELEGTHE